MEQLPLIGLTTYGRDENNRFALPAHYIDAVRRAGGIPVLLPPGETYDAQLLDRLDGLILSGGGDVNPSLYHGLHHETIYMVDPERDQSEIALVKQFIATDLPCLGICRGAQVVNVALGGSLIEHLPDVVGERVAHRVPPRNRTNHPVRLEPGSRLAAIVGQTEVTTASWHHQAIRQVAPGLKVVAHAPDGTIEAVEMPAHPWLIAVQWHPELTAADDPSQQRIFEALVAAAKNRRSQ